MYFVIIPSVVAVCRVPGFPAAAGGGAVVGLGQRRIKVIVAFCCCCWLAALVGRLCAEYNLWSADRDQGAAAATNDVTKRMGEM